MENLINKIDPKNLIGKTLEFKHYGKDQVYTIIAAKKWGKDKNDIKLVLLDLNDAKKDKIHLKELKKMLKEIEQDMDDFLNKLGESLEEEFWHLRFFSICIKNPLMRYEYSRDLNIKDYYAFNLFSDKDLIRDYTFCDNHKALSFDEIDFSQLQKAFMNFFYKELGEEYLNQLNAFYTNIIENNVKNKLQTLNKERDLILEDYNKINKIKKEKKNVVKELIKD